MSDYLVVGDVDRIQDYVFSSNRLRAIRGASALLDQTAERIYSVAPNGLCFLRWRGGQIVAILRGADEGRAKQVCAQFERAFREFSAGEAMLTTGYASYIDDQSFPNAMAHAFKMVRREKDSRQQLGSDGESIISSPYDRRCDLLSGHTAQERCLVSQTGEPDEYRYHSPAADKQWQAVLAKIPFDEGLREEFVEAGALESGQDEYGFPYSPEDLWPREGDGQYVAMVVADGNGFGRMLECIDTAELYKHYSKEIYRLTLNAVAQAAKQVGITQSASSHKRNRKWLPLIPIVLAGDDLILLTRKAYGLHFARVLCQQFSFLSMDREKYPHIQQAINLLRERDPALGDRLFPDENSGLTLSAGVAIAKRKFPISILHHLAGELRDEAKRKLRHSWATVVRENGAIDFAVITTATVQPLQNLRTRYRVDERPDRPPDDPDKWAYLTGRPYTIDCFGQLQELASELQRIPRSKRQFLYTELFKGRAAGTEAYHFVIAREAQVHQAISRAAEKLLPDALTTPFCQDVDKTWTSLIDALEMAELLGG